jgi:hypothetical protein
MKNNKLILKQLKQELEKLKSSISKQQMINIKTYSLKNFILTN